MFVHGDNIARKEKEFSKDASGLHILLKFGKPTRNGKVTI